MCHKKGETEVDSDQNLIIRIKTPLFSYCVSEGVDSYFKRFLSIINQNNSIPRYTPINEPAF